MKKNTVGSPTILNPKVGKLAPEDCGHTLLSLQNISTHEIEFSLSFRILQPEGTFLNKLILCKKQVLTVFRTFKKKTLYKFSVLVGLKIIIKKKYGIYFIIGVNSPILHLNLIPDFKGFKVGFILKSQIGGDWDSYYHCLMILNHQFKMKHGISLAVHKPQSIN